MQTLVLGGARSGKSGFAEQLAKDSGLDVVYIATAQAHDDEMRARIQHHQQQRPKTWEVIEEPLALARIIAEYACARRVILVDCLTLWLSNLLMHDDEQIFSTQRQALFTQLKLSQQAGHRIIMVSNEVGLGIVPLGELSRRFVDEAGRLHQKLAAKMDSVVFVVAGLPQVLKGSLEDK